MKNHLEKSILESIYNGRVCIEDISSDLGIEKSIVFRLLQNLIIKGFIKEKNNSYQIDQRKIDEIKEFLKDSTFLENEGRYLLHSALKDRDDQNIFMRKIFLTSEDKKFLGAILWQLESFLSKTEERNKKKEYKLKDTEIFYWVRQNFHDYIQNSIEYVGG